MAESIFITTPKTILQNLGKYLLIGVAAYGLYQSVNVAQTIGQAFKYNHRITKVEERIETNAWEEAESLLTSYAKNQALEPVEIEALTMKLAAKKSKAQVESLGEMITSGKQKEAQALYMALVEQGKLNEQEKRVYEEKTSSLSLENMLKKVVTGRMYVIKPKRIKLFDQKLFDVPDGEEPVLEL